MSTLSQFLGGDSTPIGQMAYLGVTDEPATVTIGSQKWLRTGVLAPAASYPSVPADYQRIDPTPILHETLPQGEQYNSIATNGTIWVAVGEESALATSTDGVNWTQRTITGGHYKKVIWTGTNFAAVGCLSGTVGTVFATSTDGINWTTRVVSTANNEAASSVAWSGSLYAISGGQHGSAAYIATSPDGITWTKRSIPSPATTGQFDEIVWIGNKFVAVGREPSTPSSCALTSPDGVTWTQRTISAVGLIFESICWNGTILVAGSSTAGYMFSSPDGITWTPRTYPSGANSRDIIWTGTKFISVGDGPTSQIVTSPDGITWTAVTNTFNNSLLCAAISGSNVVALGIGHVMRSSDGGTTWTSTKPTGAFATIAYNGSIFVIAASNMCATSPDGINWTKRNNFDSTILDIAVNGSLFVAVGGASTTSYITTSTDGINWTTRAAGLASTHWGSITYGAGRFVIGSNNAGYSASSTDGITWVNNLDHVTPGVTKVFYANGVFVTLASAGSPSYSYDGITWRLISNLGTTVSSIAWNGSVFAAVASGVCFTSVDGINWVSRTSTFPTGVASVAAVGGVFIAHTTNKFHTSTDGINWSAARSGTFSILDTFDVNGKLYFTSTNQVGSTSNTKYVGVTTYNKYQYVRVE